MSELPPHVLVQMQADYLRFIEWSQTRARSATESPIEALLLTALSHLQAINEGAFRLRILSAGADREASVQRHHFSRGAVIWPQQQIGPFRVDFLVLIRDWDDRLNLDRMAVIECDGHDWHERTADQAARDKGRDRYFAERGITVMRFTGREIWRDPLACARQIDVMIKNIIGDWQAEVVRLSMESERQGDG